MAATATDDAAYLIVSAAVDAAFYRWMNPGPAAQAGFDAVRHYLEHGWREGCDPAPWFSVRRYLETHPDVAASGGEPLTHYLRHGVGEGRAIFASAQAAAFRKAVGDPPWTFEPPAFVAPRALQTQLACDAGPLFREGDRAIIEADFDRKFYLAAYPDLAAARGDLIDHFLAHGWREGRDPAPWFSVRDYLSENPDVAEAGINPFVHYVSTGRGEGRSPRSTLGFRYRIIADLTSLEARIAAVAEASRHTQADPAEAFAAVVAASRTGLKDLHVTFSHDDFAANVGGVQLCLQYEAQRMAALGRDHLHLCSATPWPVLRRGQACALSVVLNGRALGAFSADAIARGLAAARSQARGASSFAIHNLLGHDVDEVFAILEAAGLNAGFFWLHDFTSLCAGYQLLRNDVQDCGAPPPDSAACGVCLYGPGRMPQVADHERLFARLRLTVVSPSQTTLDFWRSSWSFPTAGELVHPHLRLIPRGPAAATRSGPLRVAFLGMPSPHKGWPIFADLVADLASDRRYRFLHLGSRPDPRAQAEFHPVTVSLADPRAMQHALERLEVDVAVICSIFRETFCIAAYEALAAGCAIVTTPDSANVAALVEGGAPGRVLADPAALASAFVDGELLELARSVRKPSLYDLEISGMTADLLEASLAA